MYGEFIQCSCGKEFYCQSINQSVLCMYCGKEHPLSELPEEEQPAEDATEA